MNSNRRLPLTGAPLGLMSLILAILGGMHLQHLVDDGGGRHLGETIVLALGLFVGSV
ncbi:hypothetical protein OAJ44_00640 [Chloroflexi bacterium]|nr:hypothetical protein [Chloroflexota bacterium]